MRETAPDSTVQQKLQAADKSQRIEVLEPIPAQCYIFSQRTFNWLGNAIAWITAPVEWCPQLKNVPSHTGFKFVMEDGTEEGFETHSPEGWRRTSWDEMITGEGWSTMQNGDMLHSKGWVKLRKVLLTKSETIDLYNRCCEKLLYPAWMDYPEGQILRMWRHIRLGKILNPTPSPVCSEAVSRLLMPVYDLRKRDGKREKVHDAITPFDCQITPLKHRDVWEWDSEKLKWV